MTDSARARRSLGVVVASAMIANGLASAAFVVMTGAQRDDSIQGLSSATLRLAALALAVAVGGYELLVRVISRLPLPRPVAAPHVPRLTQAWVMLWTSAGAGAIFGAMIEVVQLPTDTWTIGMRALAWAFWGFALGVVSAGFVWFFARWSR